MTAYLGPHFVRTASSSMLVTSLRMRVLRAGSWSNDLVCGQPRVRPVSAPPQPPTLGGDISTNTDLLQTQEMA